MFRMGLVQPKTLKQARDIYAVNHSKGVIGNDATPPPHVRVGILGHERVGKTSLERHLAGEDFQKEEPPTCGAELTDIRTHVAATDLHRWVAVKTTVSEFQTLVARVIADTIRSIHEVKSTELTDSEQRALLASVFGILGFPFLLIELGFLGWLMILAMTLSMPVFVRGSIFWRSLSIVLTTFAPLVSHSWTITGLLEMTVLIGTAVLVALAFLMMRIEFVLGCQLMMSLLGFSPSILFLTKCPPSIDSFDLFVGFLGFNYGYASNLAVNLMCQQFRCQILIGFCKNLVANGFFYIGFGCFAWIGSWIPILREVSNSSIGVTHLLSVYSLALVAGQLVHLPLVHTLYRIISRHLLQPFTMAAKGQRVMAALLGLIMGAVGSLVIIFYLPNYLRGNCHELDITLQWGPSVPILSSLFIVYLMLLPNTNDQYRQTPEAETLKSGPLADMVEDARKNPSATSNICLKTMDFAGQEIYYAMHHIFLPGTTVYFVVFNLVQMCNHFSHHIKKLHFWLNSVLAHGGENATIFLVATHRDDEGLDMESRQQTVGKIFRQFRCFHDSIHFNSDEPDLELSIVFQIENSAPPSDPVTVSLRRQVVEAVQQTHKKLNNIPIRYLALEDDVIAMRENTKITTHKALKDKAVGNRGLGYRGLGYRGLGYWVIGDWVIGDWVILGYRGLGYRGLGYRGLGYRGLGYRGQGDGVQGYRGLGYRGWTCDSATI